MDFSTQIFCYIFKKSSGILNLNRNYFTLIIIFINLIEHFPHNKNIYSWNFRFIKSILISIPISYENRFKKIFCTSEDKKKLRNYL